MNCTCNEPSLKKKAVLPYSHPVVPSQFFKAVCNQAVRKFVSVSNKREGEKEGSKFSRCRQRDLSLPSLPPTKNRTWQSLRVLCVSS